MAYTRLNLSDGEIFNASHVTHIEDELVDLDENKADQSDVDQLKEDVSDLSKTVDTKADQSDLESLQTSVEQNTSDISDLSKTVDTKADKSDVEQNTKDIATNAENIATNTGNIATNADAISELNQSLSDFLVTQSFDEDNISISGSNGLYTSSFNVAKDGYTPLGVVGFRSGNASSSGTNSSYQCAYQAYLSGTTVSYSIRNVSSYTAVVRLYVYVLYMKNL